ncbi:hypothetical protein [uncultured Enterobacter sp.]|uniref:hypothetical protein n=1 Tax=uncultured Enterobacter sp. TaxID=238202 RepID=UPI00259137CB|nr:hypothetical protein [uncultured Enterobacter sp.]
MSFSDIVSLGGLLSGLGALFYAWRQHEKNKELSFPTRNAHHTMCYLKPFSQEVEQLADFLFNNIDRKVYLSISIAEQDAHFLEDDELNVSCIYIRYQKIRDFLEGEEATTENSLTLSLNVEKNKKSTNKCYSQYGYITLKGYFTVKNSGSPRMGEVWVTITSAES